MNKSGTNLLIFIVAIFVVACNTTPKEANNEVADSVTVPPADSLSPSLTMVWETDTTLTTNESVLLDPDTEILYVSNINGNPSDDDNNGFISKLSKNGEILELEWVTGLSAPKGMAIMNGNLYVTDINNLVEISLESGEILNEYPVENAVFLNDAVADGTNVYFSDMGTAKVHKFNDGVVSEHLSDIKNINGLAIDTNGDLLGLDAEGFRRYNIDGEPTVLNEVVTGGDGLIVIDSDTYILSRWQGEIYLVDKGTEYLLLDTKAQESNTADIGFLPEENVIVVPTFSKNKVVAYRLTY